MSHSPLTFANINREFTTTLHQRVNQYFQSKGISRFANTEMVVKTAIMFTLYFLPYTLILTGVITQVAWMIPAVVLMSLGLAGIGLSVMHDANHGAYSRKEWVNTLVGYSLNLVGANAFNWKMQHNVLHHSYTNIHEQDEDISPRGILRLDPHSDWRKIHRYQHWYAWGLYGLMTIVWLFFKDFYRLIKYNKMGLVRKNHTTIVREWLILLGTKLVYIGYIFILPLTLTSLTWWQIGLGIFIMHYIAGFLLAIIFQPAHVIEGTAYPLPNEKNQLETNWAIHQLLTTANFGNNSKWFSWYAGGLNFQIEHHLFPNICHVHYRKLAEIVKQTAEEYNIPYRSFNSFGEALSSHARLLRKLGLKPVMVKQ